MNDINDTLSSFATFFMLLLLVPTELLSGKKNYFQRLFQIEWRTPWLNVHKDTDASFLTNQKKFVVSINNLPTFFEFNLN